MGWKINSKDKLLIFILVGALICGLSITFYGANNPLTEVEYIRTDTGEQITISTTDKVDSVSTEQNDEVEVEPVTYYTYNEEYTNELIAYQAINKDVIGTIKIAGTNLNHPIVQTIGDEGYYLRKDLNHRTNSHGVPFLDEDNHLEGEGENLILFGHAITLPKPDSFGELQRYESVNYYKAHPYIETTSASGTRKWVVIAAFLADTKEDFEYSEYDIFDNQFDFQDWYDEVQKRNWLNVEIPAQYGDTFMSLSTCAYESTSETARMCVVAKLLDSTSDYSLAIENALQSENPLMPKALSWYKVSRSRWVQKYIDGYTE